jgi:hypothetical protein
MQRDNDTKSRGELLRAAQVAGIIPILWNLERH